MITFITRIYFLLTELPSSSTPSTSSVEEEREPRHMSAAAYGSTVEVPIETDSDVNSSTYPCTTTVEVWQADYFDIGDINRDLLDNNMKKNILTSVLLPRQPYAFPMTEGKKQKRSFQEKWIKDRETETGFPFLAYSKKEDGVYCKPCYLFFHEGVGKGDHENPGRLVTSSFRDWKKARETFLKHSNKEYHKNCVVLAEKFLEVFSGKRQDIMSQLNSQRAREKEENRAAIKPIIETILFCAEQELPLRGDHDSGPLSLDKPEKKDGKFRALLRFRANSGDEDLKRHIINSRRNAMYLSPDIQNEIIQICSNIVTEEIVSKINNASCFSLLADETMDISSTEQLSICVRYVDLLIHNGDSQTLVIREDFLGFIPIHDQSAENLTKVILQRCEELGLDMSKCVGQGYDGAANMAGHISGVQSRIRQQYPKVRYVHCASHRLNLALSNAMSIPMVKNCLGVVNELANFFRNHPNANKTLQDAISVHAPESRKRRLLRLCETRFIERHDSVLTFVEIFKSICISLEEISNKTWKISSTALTLLAAVEKSDFLVSLLVCDKLFSFTLPLSVFIQDKSLDLASALSHAKEVIVTLKKQREDAEKCFKDIFNSASRLAEEVFLTKLTVPRLTSRQTMRANPQITNVEEYYRVTVFIPCVESLIQNLSDRFISNEDILQSFQVLLPGYASIDETSKLESLSPYFDDQMSLSAVKAEYELWCERASTIDTDSEVLKVLEYCNATYYRTINHLLTVLATLPVTTASVERSFSTMKRVKTLPRSVMNDDRLSALAMISIHWDVTVDPDKVINIMAGKKSRRLLL